MNTTYGSPGRFGNQFIRNICAHLLSRKNDLHFSYYWEDRMNALGINLYHGKNTYPIYVNITDDNFLYHLKEIPHTNYNIITNGYYQTKDIAFVFKEYFDDDLIKQNILSHNKFKDRYNANNDLFIHVRLDDVENMKMNLDFEYYDKCCSLISFEKGYISSDTITSNICKRLIEKYNLEIIQYNEVETIMFGSTCKNVVLSKGTFSWVIGLLSFFSKVYYHNTANEKQLWYGDNYVFTEWIKITV